MYSVIMINPFSEIFTTIIISHKMTMMAKYTLALMSCKSIRLKFPLAFLISERTLIF